MMKKILDVACKVATLASDLLCGRDLHVNGKMTTEGNAVFKRNVVIEGLLKAQNLENPCLGLYATEEQLSKTWPRPVNGNWALVGDTVPADIYQAYGGRWQATGKTGGAPMINSAVYDQRLDSLEAGLAELEAAMAQLDTGSDNNSSDSSDISAEEIARLAASVNALGASIELLSQENREALKVSFMSFSGSLENVSGYWWETTDEEVIEVRWDDENTRFVGKRSGDAKWYTEWRGSDLYQSSRRVDGALPSVTVNPSQLFYSMMDGYLYCFTGRTLERIG